MAALRPVARGVNGAVSVFLDGPVGFPEEGGMSAAMFREQVARADGAPLVVNFNSPGGLVTDGMAIYNTLRGYKGKKVGIVTGIAASIASVVLMACDEIRVAKGAYVMIHNPSGGAKGGADDLRAAAETLESMRSELLDIYEARTGCERKKLEEMLDAETYMTAEEALENGFADKVETFEARIELRAVARLDPDKVPAELRAAAKGKERAMKPKMKAAIEAAEEKAKALRAKAEADPDAEPEDSEDEPHDAEEDEPAEDTEEEEEEKKEGEKALLASVYSLTGTASPAVALGKLGALVSKGASVAASNRAEQVTAAVKAGVLLPALTKEARKWPEKTWNTFLASVGGAKALKLGAKHTPPKETPEERDAPIAAATGDAAKILRQMGVKQEDLSKPTPNAPQNKKGAAN
jgi:ATP-dependent Clp endopeptidase proteolytic subunit ClpP